MNNAQSLHSTLSPSLHGFEIAIIGMAGVFPDAEDIQTFWRNIAAGVEAIRELSDAELDVAGVSLSERQQADFIRRASFLKDAEAFDAAFFGYSPREAQIIDPQQRLFLENAWLALEHAGYAPAKFTGQIGVFASASGNTYALDYLLKYPDVRRIVSSEALLLDNYNDMLSTRVAYKLNLKGPAMTIGCACSSSLVAIHYACQSLLAGECDIAIGGGVHVGFPLKKGYHFENSGILSHDGRCRSFDAQASGTVAGDGCGVVILKRLQDALNDGDRICAIIKGSAVNNDGSSKAGFTAPSVNGQTEVLRRALVTADVAPESVGYIEAHGTATRLGDPMELKALLNVYGKKQGPEHRCAVTSLKANIGHLDSAAGVAGVIKVTQMLKHRYLPPAVNFSSLNPEIDLQGSALYIPQQGESWQGDNSRRAGVSAFGMGGTNVHMLLEESSFIAPSGPARDYQLLCFSAKSATALRDGMTRMQQWFTAAEETGSADEALADIAWTLQVGREEMPYRCTLVCRDHQQVLADIAHKLTQPEGIKSLSNPQTIFMFSGQGTQYPGMMHDHYQHEPVFRQHVDECALLLEPLVGCDIRSVIFEKAENDAPSSLYQTRFTQPALFVVEYALSQLLMSWGVVPAACIGHSIGEYVAASLAGVFSLPDALRIVVRRAALMNDMPPGKMLAVGLSATELAHWLPEGTSLASENAPEFCVAAGNSEAITALQTLLEAKGVAAQPLHTSHAFHSSMMDGCLSAFKCAFDDIALSPPTRPFISCVTGDWIRPEQATSPDYWVSQLRQPVAFSQGVKRLLDEPQHLLLEVGPGNALTSLARLQLNEQAVHRRVLNSGVGIYQPEDGLKTLLTAMGELWCQGVTIDWPRLYEQQQRRRVPLPGYAFQRQHYSLGTLVSSTCASVNSERLAMTEWCYQSCWKQLPELPTLPASWRGRTVVIFMDSQGCGKHLAHLLEEKGARVWRISKGRRYRLLKAGYVMLNAQCAGDYQQLATCLAQAGQQPDAIIHCWSMTGNRQLSLKDAIAHYESLLHIARHFYSRHEMQPLNLFVLSSQLYALTDDEQNAPDKALIIGPCRVIPKEFSDIRCKWIDFVPPPRMARRATAKAFATLLAEMQFSDKTTQIALRGTKRYMPVDEQVHLQQQAEPYRFREKGNYLITGGFGGIGSTIAKNLAHACQARMLLIVRGTLPPETEWNQWLAQHDASNEKSRRIRFIRELQQMGAEVTVLSASLDSEREVSRGITAFTQRYGRFHGVFHCAGVADGSLIQNRSLDDSLRVFQAKVQGTCVLERVLRQHKLDFFVICSSRASRIGAPGQVAYCSANAWQDAWVLKARHQQDQDSETCYLAIGWDAWQEVGMAVDSLQKWYGDSGENTLRHAITPQEGWTLMTQLLTTTGGHYLVSTRGLSFLDSDDETITVDEQESDAISPPSGELFPRPSLSCEYQPPRNEIERQITAIWQEKMGMGPLGIHDDFFELNGHSLMAVQIIALIRQRLKVALPTGFTYDHPTIALLSEQVQLRLQQNEKDSQRVMEETQ